MFNINIRRCPKEAGWLTKLLTANNLPRWTKETRRVSLRWLISLVTNHFIKLPPKPAIRCLYVHKLLANNTRKMLQITPKEHITNYTTNSHNSRGTQYNLHWDNIIITKVCFRLVSIHNTASLCCNWSSEWAELQLGSLCTNSYV
jgi:hypothetical protein